MPEDYMNLAEALQEIGLPCAENAWNTRPKGSYITYALEFEADADYGDNLKIGRAWEGSIDLFATSKRGDGYPAQIEAALNANCDGCWRCERHGTWEQETGLFHFEWVFQVEG